jgi:acyl carrier protein
MESIEEKIKDIMADILDIDDKETITDDFSPEDAESWDSLNNLKLITAFEEEFEISLTMEQINSMVNFGKIKQIIAESKK